MSGFLTLLSLPPGAHQQWLPNSRDLIDLIRDAT